ncbi:peptidase inhibitor family I36 protein [Amycolatopsis sp. TRM77291]
MKKLFATIAAGAALSAGVAFAGTASAETTAGAAPASQEGGVSITAYSDCPSGWFCAWEHANAQGRMVRFQTGSANLQGQNFNDQISSVYNHTNRIWCTYTDANYGGTLWRVSVGWHGNVPAHMNDRISSLRGC